MLLASYLVYQSIGELLVYCVVVLPIGHAEDWACMSDVAQWPQALVREPVVIAVFLFGVEPDATKPIARVVWGYLQPVM
jgi:hypothetical protein